MLAQDSISLGRSDVIVAGGQENMSMVPYLLPKARAGLRLGPGNIEDGIIKDGLWDPYHNFHMGNAGKFAPENTKSVESNKMNLPLTVIKSAKSPKRKSLSARDSESGSPI